MPIPASSASTVDGRTPNYVSPARDKNDTILDVLTQDFETYDKRDGCRMVSPVANMTPPRSSYVGNPGGSDQRP